MGGAQSLLIELTAAQKHLGHEVNVVQLVEAQDDTVTQKIRKLGVSVDSLKCRGSLYNPLLILSIIPLLRRYDVVHVHLFPALYWAGFAKLLAFSNTPLVYTEHSTFNKRRGNRLLHAVDAFVYRRLYRRVVACSDKAKEILEQCYPKLSVISIPNGVDIQKYETAEPYSKRQLCKISEDSFVVTMVARFDYPKRQDTIVKAIAQLPAKFHAVLVGSQPTDKGLVAVQQLSEQLRVAERVHFLYIRSDVPRILKSSDAIVMSSEYEGLSLSSIEGMAAGRPFIATNVNGLREVVQNFGILFECGQETELAHILLQLESDKHYYKQVVAQCTARSKQFDIAEVAKKYIDVYNVMVHKDYSLH
jgi:glycosyltransferase involved in cell wall biosynthesis